eukprot:gene3477-2428_t
MPSARYTTLTQTSTTLTTTAESTNPSYYTPRFSTSIHPQTNPSAPIQLHTYYTNSQRNTSMVLTHEATFHSHNPCATIKTQQTPEPIRNPDHNTHTLKRAFNTSNKHSKLQIRKHPSNIVMQTCAHPCFGITHSVPNSCTHKRILIIAILYNPPRCKIPTTFSHPRQPPNGRILCVSIKVHQDHEPKASSAANPRRPENNTVHYIHDLKHSSSTNIKYPQNHRIHKYSSPTPAPTTSHLTPSRPTHSAPQHLKPQPYPNSGYTAFQPQNPLQTIKAQQNRRISHPAPQPIVHGAPLLNGHNPKTLV